MLCPRIHQKYLQIAIRGFGIPENPPTVRTIATSYAAISMDHLHELRLAFCNDGVFDRNQHRSPVKVGCSLSDDNRHAPVVPWTQIHGRFRESCEKRE